MGFSCGFSEKFYEALLWFNVNYGIREYIKYLLDKISFNFMQAFIRSNERLWNS